MNRNIAILSFSFALIFFASNGVQQYVTSFFSAAGLADVGFTTLIILYLSVTLSDPLSAILVSRYGAKKAMIMGSVFYALFIAVLPSRSVYAIYTAAIMLGIGAATIWTGQNSYLLRASQSTKYGTNAGVFATTYHSATSIGILALGFLIYVLPIGVPFLAFAAIPLVGTMLLFRLDDLKGGESKDHLHAIKKAFSSPTALRMSTISLVSSFAYGLVISIIPLKLSAAIGIQYAGILLAFFSACPILFSFILGRMSDVTGRTMWIAASYALLLAGLVMLALSQAAAFLVAGVLMLAFNYALIQPVNVAFIGDLTTTSNLVSITALFWMAKSSGMVTALILSRLLMNQPFSLYSAAIGVVILSSVLVYPLLKTGTGYVRNRISSECE